MLKTYKILQLFSQFIESERFMISVKLFWINYTDTPFFGVTRLATP